MKKLIILTLVLILFLFSGCNQTSYPISTEKILQEPIKEESKQTSKEVNGFNVSLEKKKFCEDASDCVANSCCHPSYTINKKYAPDCGGIGCTAVCSSILDCKSWKPICENNLCNYEIENQFKEKYYDWRIWFVIYKSTGRVVEFASEDEFELTAQAILSIIQPTEYDISSLNISYQGIDNWYTGGEKTGKKNGFKIDVTQKGYEKTISKIKDIEYLQSIYFNIIIDPEIQKIPKNEGEISSCEFDRECIKVGGDCCGCSSGGSASTINRAYYDYWSDKLEENCKRMACIAVISNHWTCFAEPRCVNNKCELVETQK